MPDFDVRPWDVYWAYVPFEEKDGTIKHRPAVIVQIDQQNERYAAFKTTSQPPRSNFPGEYEIIEWKGAGLKKASVLRLSQPIELNPRLLGRKIGTLQRADRVNVYRILSELYPRRQ